MRYKELVESIEDKGILKAMFFAGLPGAGKSSVAKRITNGSVAPRHINTDRSYEFLLNKYGNDANPVAWSILGQSAKAINTAALTNYLNSMLPLFVDGTSSNPNAAVRRAGLAESLGYDTMMVWVNIEFETALQRVQQRERKVSVDFIKKVYDLAAGNKELYRNRFGENFIEVDNNADNFDVMEMRVFTASNKFFNSPVQNQIGARLIKQMSETGDKYLTPTVYTKEYLDKVVSVWYMK